MSQFKQPVVGVNLAELLRAAKRMGVQVRALRRTGELQLRHPAILSRPRINGRRKDAPLSAVAFVRQVHAWVEASE